MNRAETLAQLARLCRMRSEDAPAIEQTGWSELDRALAGGWQAGTIVELMPAEPGIGELRLVMPVLARITAGDRHIALIAPPYIPYAPALAQQGIRLERLVIIQAAANADVLWAFEQTLRCKSFGAVLAWPAQARDRETRRLQLAAEAGRSTGFMYRSTLTAREASPAAVRLKLQSDPRGGLHIEVIKCRGNRSGASICLPLTHLEPEPARTGSALPPSSRSASTSAHLEPIKSTEQDERLPPSAA